MRPPIVQGYSDYFANIISVTDLDLYEMRMYRIYIRLLNDSNVHVIRT